MKPVTYTPLSSIGRKTAEEIALIYLENNLGHTDLHRLSRMSGKGTRIFVAKQNDHILGFGCLNFVRQPTSTTAEIFDLLLHPAMGMPWKP